MSVNIKTAMQQIANKVGVAESAANLMADEMISQGYDMSKPTKNKPNQEEIEATEAAQKAQQGNPDTTPADAQLRVQPAPMTDTKDTSKKG